MKKLYVVNDELTGFVLLRPRLHIEGSGLFWRESIYAAIKHINNRKITTAIR